MCVLLSLFPVEVLKGKEPHQDEYTIDYQSDSHILPHGIGGVESCLLYVLHHGHAKSCGSDTILVEVEEEGLPYTYVLSGQRIIR